MSPVRDVGVPIPRDPSRLTAIVFAGASGPPAARGGLNKNYFTLRGKPVVQHQLDVLAAMGFRRTVLVTELSRARALTLPCDTTVLPSSPFQSSNFVTVRRAVSFDADERALVLFGDTPLIAPGAVLDFLARCAANPADFHHGLVPYAFAEPFMDFFPRDREGRQPFHLREFPARLGCLSLMRPAGYDPETTRQAVNTVMAGRKQDTGRGGFFSILVARSRVVAGGLRFFGPMGLWLGLSAIVAHWLHERGFPKGARFVARPVTLARLDGVTSKLLGCSARMLACPFGGTSLDIDSEADLAVAEKHFDQLARLQAVQERLVTKLVDPGFDLGPECLRALERFDPEAASEVRRHPEVYREQQRILRLAAAVSAAAASPEAAGGRARAGDGREGPRAAPAP
jgi:CTP:molybdopterin cytidylyltransferase MocA